MRALPPTRSPSMEKETPMRALPFASSVVLLLPSPTLAQSAPRATFGPQRAGPGPALCAPRLADAASPGACLEAASTPTLGSLFPLSPELFVAASNGWVGLGTTAPQARLDVRGGVRVDGQLRFEDDLGGIQFSSDDGSPFGGSAPMLSLFASGTANPDRMLVAHSPAFADWGILYEDLEDRFVFQRGGSPVLSVDLGGTSVTVHDGSTLVADDNLIVNGVLSLNDRVFANEFVSIVTDDPILPVLEVTSTSGAAFDTMVVGRTVAPSFGNVNLLVQAPAATGFSNYDHILVRNITTFDSEFRVDAFGNVYADGAHTGPADFAEMLRVTSGAATVEPGDLLVIDPAESRGVRLSTRPRSRLVAGIYSTNPGFVGSEREWEIVEAVHEPLPGGARQPGATVRSLSRADMATLHDEVPVAVVGIVPAKASAENGSIRPGDLLVSSATPGHVMRDDDPRIGTVVGKALEGLAGGTGSIRVLVTLQ